VDRAPHPERPTWDRLPAAIGRRAALAALAALASLASAACRGGAARERGARVVSISPSTTEAAFAIGAGDLLVGRSKYCDYPPEAAKLPPVGGYADPSVEAIVALSPTLVIGARGPAGPALEQALAAHAIETFFPETESVAQIEGMLEELGKKLGRAEGAAAAVGRVRERREAVAKAVAGLPKVRVALLFDVAPIVVAGPGGFPDELLRLAGGTNVITRGGAYPTINLEHLLALDPDLLLDTIAMATGGAAEPLAAQRSAPGWKELRAVREGRVRAIDSSTVLRPGPRIGEGLAALARAVHGDAIARLL
jgi:iron complex transport system substrate-binding protein